MADQVRESKLLRVVRQGVCQLSFRAVSHKREIRRAGLWHVLRPRHPTEQRLERTLEGRAGMRDSACVLVRLPADDGRCLRLFARQAEALDRGLQHGGSRIIARRSACILQLAVHQV